MDLGFHDDRGKVYPLFVPDFHTTLKGFQCLVPEPRWVGVTESWGPTEGVVVRRGLRGPRGPALS